MKIKNKKNILQKTMIGILMVLTLNFIVPTYSHADWGGMLASPVVDLFCSVGDAVINLLQKCMMGEFGSKDLDFSFNMFMVEDDEFFSDSKYDEYEGPAENESHVETIDIDAKDADGNNIGFEKGWFGKSNKYHIPIATYSPEQIFAGNVAGLDINFIKPNKYEGQNESSASKLQPTIATWYVALRNLTVVGLLSILVYVGIRIILSSTAGDKAKYKQMLKDWLIALCLVFFLHYIMSFVLTMTESICTAINGDGATGITVNVESTDNTSRTFHTNLLGLARFKTQYADFGQKVSYLIMYIFLVGYTLLFTWFYLKRLLMMAFLTLIAPLVALTYPIDKMNDGKAQAFDMWLKEYVFNALIQPFHLIIYTVFVGSAMDLASTNIIYTIAAIAFILPAEKILRNFFGFQKAGATMGALGGFAAANIMNKLGSGKRGGSSSTSGKDTEEGKSPTFKKKHDVDQVEGGNKDSSENDKKENGNNPEEEKDKPDDIHNRAKEELEKDKEEQERKEQQGQEQSEGEGQELEDKTKEESNEGQNDEHSDIKPDEKGQNKSSMYHGKEDQEKMRQRANHLGRGLSNIVNARGGVGKIAKRRIKGAARFATKASFTLAGASLGAIAGIASGKGISGAVAGIGAGATLGKRLGNTATQIPSKVGKAGKTVTDKARKEWDTFNGNTKAQDRATSKQMQKDENNRQYVKDWMTKENNGAIPSSRQISRRMKELDTYFNEGLSVDEAIRARKAENEVGDSKKAAIIAAIGKERGITADTLNDEKREKAARKNLAQEYKNKGYSDYNAQADRIIKVLKIQNGVAHNVNTPEEQKPTPKPNQQPTPKQQPTRKQQPSRKKATKTKHPQPNKPPRQNKPNK